MGSDDEDSKGIIIDEVLCYIQNKMKILSVDNIVILCEPVFDAEQVENAKERLFELCHQENDKTERKTRIGQHKNERNIRDICNLFEEKGNDAPVFVAQDLNNLPPVTINCLDVSLLLSENKRLQAEVKILKEAVNVQKETSSDMFDMMKDIYARLDMFESPIRSEPADAPRGRGTSERQMPEANQVASETPPTDLDPNAQAFDNHRSSYAGMARKFRGNNIAVDEEGFVIVGKDGKPLRTRPVNSFPHQQSVKKPKQSTTGSSTRNNLTAATRILKASVFATRFAPETTADEVKNELKADDRLKDLDLSVEKVATKYDSYASFHVTCVCKEAESKLFLEPDVWPAGILFRPWKEKRTPRSEGNNTHYRLHRHSSGWRA